MNNSENNSDSSHTNTNSSNSSDTNIHSSNSSNTNSHSLNNTSNTNSSNNSDSNTTSSNNTNSSNSSNTTLPVVYINETINGDGFQATNNQTSIPDVSVTTHSNFTTTDSLIHVPQINENVEYEYDDNIITANDNIVSEIRHFATQIKCEDFHGKGSIDDYAALFQAASQIANAIRYRC